MQSRDPFSGDCDLRARQEEGEGLGALAEPRPVLRGLRRGLLLPPGRAPASPDLQSRDPFSGDCDPGNRKPHPCRISSTCRAETRSQGIATAVGLDVSVGAETGRLQSRDPFSGDCDWTSPGAHQNPQQPLQTLQSRDPFSGDCDKIIAPAAAAKTRSTCRAETRSQGIATITTARSRLAKAKKSNLQSRDPFSGDCDHGGR